MRPVRLWHGGEKQEKKDEKGMARPVAGISLSTHKVLILAKVLILSPEMGGTGKHRSKN